MSNGVHDNWEISKVGRMVAGCEKWIEVSAEGKRGRRNGNCMTNARLGEKGASVALQS